MLCGQGCILVPFARVCVNADGGIKSGRQERKQQVQQVDAQCIRNNVPSLPHDTKQNTSTPHNGEGEREIQHVCVCVCVCRFALLLLLFERVHNERKRKDKHNNARPTAPPHCTTLHRTAPHLDQDDAGHEKQQGNDAKDPAWDHPWCDGVHKQPVPLPAHNKRQATPKGHQQHTHTDTHTHRQ